MLAKRLMIVGFLGVVLGQVGTAQEIGYYSKEYWSTAAQRQVQAIRSYKQDRNLQLSNKGDYSTNVFLVTS